MENRLEHVQLWIWPHLWFLRPLFDLTHLHLGDLHHLRTQAKSFLQLSCGNSCFDALLTDLYTSFPFYFRQRKGNYICLYCSLYFWRYPHKLFQNLNSEVNKNTFLSPTMCLNGPDVVSSRRLHPVTCLTWMTRTRRAVMETVTRQRPERKHGCHGGVRSLPALGLHLSCDVVRETRGTVSNLWSDWCLKTSVVT